MFGFGLGCGPRAWFELIGTQKPVLAEGLGLRASGERVWRFDTLLDLASTTNLNVLFRFSVFFALRANSLM